MANSNRTSGLLPVALSALSIAVGASAADPGETAAPAGEPQAPATDGAASDIGEVVVTGYRLSLRNTIDIKKNADVMMDARCASDWNGLR